MVSDRAIAQKLCICTTHATKAGAGIVPSCAPRLRAGWDHPRACQGVLTTMDSSLLPQPVLRSSLTPRDPPAGWIPRPTEKSVPRSEVPCNCRQTSGMQAEHGRETESPSPSLRCDLCRSYWVSSVRRRPLAESLHALLLHFLYSPSQPLTPPWLCSVC